MRINLDETSLCLFQGSGKGTVRIRKRKQNPSNAPLQKVSRNIKRSCLTHIALVCDRTDLQPRLPQIIIGNEATFQAKGFQALVAACPPNVHLIRQKSAWNNADVCRRVICLLGAALRAYLDSSPQRLQPVLLMDACRLHLHISIARACLAQKIWLIVVPAKMTWLLQPLDTHAFSRYKVYLRTAYQRARIATADGEVSVAQFLQVVRETIRMVLQGTKWARAFDEDGFGANQALVSGRVLRELQMSTPPTAPAVVPTEAVLKLCYPKRCAIPAATLLRPFLPPTQLALPAPSPSRPLAMPVGRRLVMPRPAVPAAAAVGAAGPVTRSQSRLVAALAKGPPVVPRLHRPPADGRQGG